MRLWHLFRDQSTALQGAAAAVAIIVAGASGVAYFFAPDTPPIPEQVTTQVEVTIPSGIHFTFEEWEEKQRYLRAQIEAELEQANAERRDQLLAQLSEVHERLLNNAHEAYEQELERIKRLQADLDTLRGQVPEEQLKAAAVALAEGDTQAADALFADVETRGTEIAATAAYARGEIAEGDIRWADAAHHYARAADLAPSYDRLRKAAEFTWRAGDYAAAFEYGEQMLDAAQQNGSETDLATALNNLAGLLKSMGRYDEAEPLYRQAIAIDKATLGEDHPDFATSLNNLASLLNSIGRYDEAEPLYRQAIAIDKATLGEDHPNYATRLNNLALLLDSMGRDEEAEPLYRHAIAIGKATQSENHPDYASRLNNLAALLRSMGRYDEAEPLYRQAIAIGKATLGDDHPDYASNLNNLAVLYYHMQRFEEAAALMEQALAIREAKLPEGHPHIEQSRKSLAAIRAKLP